MHLPAHSARSDRVPVTVQPTEMLCNCAWHAMTGGGGGHGTSSCNVRYVAVQHLPRAMLVPHCQHVPISTSGCMRFSVTELVPRVQSSAGSHLAATPRCTLETPSSMVIPSCSGLQTSGRKTAHMPQSRSLRSQTTVRHRDTFCRRETTRCTSDGPAVLAPRPQLACLAVDLGLQALCLHHSSEATVVATLYRQVASIRARTGV